MKFRPIPTIIVAVAVMVMIGLGIWQLRRAEWKDALLARYEEGPRLPAIAWPAVPTDPEELFFRRASGFCLEVVGWREIAGRNLEGEPGWSHIASCRTGAEGPGMAVDAGWSRSSESPSWRGGPVHGVIAPDRLQQIRLVAANPAPGLKPSAPPSPETISNNHLLYAVQWFLFALIAAIIYVIAVRRRHFESSPK
jgi:cytochrome oxidase assembly protein ShyY1